MPERIICSIESLPEVICDTHPEWQAICRAAWQMAFENIEYPVKPGWKPQLSCMPGSGNIWQWDSCFMALFARYSNGTLPGMNNLDNLYRMQAQDGYISMTYVIDTEEEAYGQRVNPPLYAWVEWEYYLVTGDDSRFQRVLPHLISYFDWLKTNRTRASGLYWFEDTGSTGMDNSPRSGYMAAHGDGSDVCFIDMACQQALSAMYIARIADYLGHGNISARFAEEHAALKGLINEYHWSERFGFYFDLFSRSSKSFRHNFINHKTLAALWSLISHVAGDRQVDRLLEHLLNPEEFWTPHPLPSLSRDDPNYSPLGDYWLGGVWAPTNYMTVKGLAVRGHRSAAREIAIRHLNAMVAVMQNESYAGIWECYAPEYMRPATKSSGDGLVRNNFVGWSGLGPIAMLIENILGFAFDASANSIEWTIGMPGRHGLRNMNFNGGTVSLIFEPEMKGNGRVVVEMNKILDLSISVFGKYKEGKYSLKPGRHELCLP